MYDRYVCSEIGSTVTAVIVTYNPDVQRLTEVLLALFPQVESTIIVDNGSSTDILSLVDSFAENNIHAICLHENRGIAAAQNIGINWAQKAGKDFILLMDQDSVPDKDMVSYLFSEYRNKVLNEHRKISAIGPLFKDSKSGKCSMHVYLKRFGRGRIHCKSENKAVPVDLLIASGSLIDINVLQSVGYMDDKLFIDCVDIEWILRARAKGYEALGHCAAFMTHSMGEYRARFWFGRWRNVPMHKPFRYYYIFRNSLLICQRDYPCKVWKQGEIVRLFNVFVFMMIFHPRRIEVVKMIFHGVVDGLTGKTGQLSV